MTLKLLVESLFLSHAAVLCAFIYSLSLYAILLVSACAEEKEQKRCNIARSANIVVLLRSLWPQTTAEREQKEKLSQ